MSLFIELPIPVDEHVPDGYRLIVAYAKEDSDEVVIPIDETNLSEETHNCDWEGCTSVSHVVRFSISKKYEMVQIKEGEK